MPPTTPPSSWLPAPPSSPGRANRFGTKLAPWPTDSQPSGTGDLGDGGSEGGASVHYGNPWQDPPSHRDPVRQARASMPWPVTVWLAGASGAQPGSALLRGLTVSSVMVAQGEPPLLAGLLPPLSDLAEVIAVPGATFTVSVLGQGQQRYARHFSGEPTIPDQELAYASSPFGPVLSDVPTWLGCRCRSGREFGWSLLVEAEVVEAHTTSAAVGLAWYRGGFARVLGEHR